MIPWVGLISVILVAALPAIQPAKLDEKSQALSAGADCYQINIAASNRPNTDLLFDKPNFYLWQNEWIRTIPLVKGIPETHEYMCLLDCHVKVCIETGLQDCFFFFLYADGSKRSDMKLNGDKKRPSSLTWESSGHSRLLAQGVAMFIHSSSANYPVQGHRSY